MANGRDLGALCQAAAGFSKLRGAAVLCRSFSKLFKDLCHISGAGMGCVPSGSGLQVAHFKQVFEQLLFPVFLKVSVF